MDHNSFGSQLSNQNHDFDFTGGIIMFGALYLFDDEFIHIVSISFTVLILTELIMIALTVRTWHWLMVVAEVISFGLYSVSVIILSDDYFGKPYFKIFFLDFEASVFAVV